MIKTFFLLLCAHALTDTALQTPWMAMNKHPSSSPLWPYALTSHGLINGLGVYMVTNSVTLGIAETILHGLIDLGKCQGLYGLKMDQSLHLICKLLWTYAASKRFY